MEPTLKNSSVSAEKKLQNDIDCVGPFVQALPADLQLALVTASDKVLDKYNRIEPEVTRDLAYLCRITSGELSGLEFRLKCKESLYRKIATIALATPKKAIVDIVNSVRDCLRYTIVYREQIYTASVLDALKHLKEEGVFNPRC